MAQSKIDIIITSLLNIVKAISGTKLYIIDKNKDEYLIKYVSKGDYLIRRYPKGEPSKKRLTTKVPDEFIKTIDKVMKIVLVNDKLNKDDKINFVVYSLSSSSSN